MNDDFKLYNFKEAAEYLKVSITTLRRWQLEGYVKYIQYKKWGPIFFDKNYLQEFIRSNIKQITIGQ